MVESGRTKPHDERRHAPSTDGSEWVEAWLFDFAQHDGSLALSAEFLVWANRNRAGFHAAIVRPGKPLVALVDAEAAAPKTGLEIRGPGIWMDVGIQTPLDHMTLDTEAFAVALEDPSDSLTGAFGFRTAIGSEIEFDTAGPIARGPSPDSYEVPCRVHGELLIDEATIEIDGWGWRSHRWGVPTSNDRTRLRGLRSDGTWFREHAPDMVGLIDVLGAAPVPDPTTGGSLYQWFGRRPDGSLAWARSATAD